MEKDRIVPYLDRLYGYAFSLCVDRESAKDLVQDGVVRALQARRVPVDENAFRAWLFTIVRNLHFDVCRRTAGQGNVVADEQLELADPAGDFDIRLINVLSVRQGLDKLSPLHREIIGLIDLAGFNYGEAAELLDVPAGTVMSRISRARQELLSAMQDTNIRMVPARTRRAER